MRTHNDAQWLAELHGHGFPGSLIILVPHNRRAEAVYYTACQFALQGEGSWQVQNVSIAVITWEDLLQSFGTVTSQEFG